MEWSHFGTVMAQVVIASMTGAIIFIMLTSAWDSWRKPK